MDNLLVEMGKWNLNLQDLLMTINLFSKITVDAQGQFHFHTNHSQAGNYIELYAPMDTLVVLTALQHPMDPNPTYAPRPIALTWSRAEGEDVAAYCRAFREENARAFHNTERFCL